jgi:hypothetical protein
VDKPASVPTQRAIVLTFDENGNVALQATPEVSVSDYILGAFSLQRQANRIMDSATRDHQSPLVIPRPTVVPS